jgi:hypothetical protein
MKYCWIFFHDWSPWEPTNIPSVQQRRCVRCGLMQRRPYNA